ncbi:MAG: CHAT domain-containing protein, partial [Crocinitomicaceae bacterium]|nr:CHAT domain-containing protein [Crocinitomicaceae bacterium]
DAGLPKLNYVMYRSFFSKIDTLLQKRKIGKAVIITDGYLNNLNFDILQTDTSKFPSMVPSALLLRYKFSYAISAKSLLNKSQDARRYTKLNILAPVYTSTFYPRLIFSEKLVDQLNELYCTKNLNNISKSNVFKENQFLQFIGHVNSSYFQNEQFLILDDSNAISSRNFENTPINGSSYLLNGCQSGVGRNIKYDRVNNFTHVLLKNNAHSVISTVWPIDDRENAKFQEKFYSFLAQGLSSSDALHETKLYFAQHDYPVSLWGAYVFYGHDFYLSPKKPGYNPLYLILLGLSIATAIFFLMRTRSKKTKPQ